MTLAIVFPYPLQTKKANAASGQIIQDTQADFQAGAVDNTLELNQAPGDVKLKQNLNTYTETTKEDFERGDIQPDSGYNRTNISESEDSELTLGKGYTYYYSSDTVPAIGHQYAMHAFADFSDNLIYVSTWGWPVYYGTDLGGLSVLDTKGTPLPNDDTLVMNYRVDTNPAIGSNVVLHSFLDKDHNLLYVSTITYGSTGPGGLSVINTQGTKDPSDDTLVIRYSTTSTPAIASNEINSSYLDTQRNRLYVSTGNGLSVIDTKGTVDPADDVLIKTYRTSSTPAIAGNSISQVLFDEANDLLYVSTNNGLSVLDINTDLVVKTYNTSTSPAIIGNSVGYVYLNQSDNLLYIYMYKFWTISSGHEGNQRYL